MKRDAAPQHPIRRNLRLPGYDYSSEGTYFVTICTHDQRCVLGEVVDSSFRANTAGNIVKECWYELPYHYAGLALDAFAVMPNHMHGVLAFLDDVGAGLKPAPTTPWLSWLRVYSRCLGIRPSLKAAEIIIDAARSGSYNFTRTEGPGWQ